MNKCLPEIKRALIHYYLFINYPLSLIHYYLSLRRRGMQYTHKCTGTCSRAIEIDVKEDGTVNSVKFIGGCHGNTQGISALVQGMPAAQVIERLQGIRCKERPTSCPDQLAQALKDMAIQ